MLQKCINRIKNRLITIKRRKYKKLFQKLNIYYDGELLIDGNLHIKKGNNSEIRIGNHFVFKSGINLNPLSRNIEGCIVTENNAKVLIGKFVGISSSCIWSHKSITIGSHTRIGADCLIVDSDCHSLNFLDRRTMSIDNENKIDREIIIGSDVLIGARSIILKGVTIGDRSVIGAGSVVTTNIPSDCIAAGNPAKIIKHLRNDIHYF